MLIAATIEAQEILGVPETVETTDARLTPGPGVNVYYLDATGLIVNPYQAHGPVVAVTASDTRGVSRRAHWGSVNGGGMGHVAGV
jgi:hypothetical protein